MVKLCEIFILKEAKCPKCGDTNAYVGFNSVECTNIRCSNFSQKQGDGIDIVIYKNTIPVLINVLDTTNRGNSDKRIDDIINYLNDLLDKLKRNNDDSKQILKLPKDLLDVVKYGIPACDEDMRNFQNDDPDNVPGELLDLAREYFKNKPKFIKDNNSIL